MQSVGEGQWPHTPTSWASCHVLVESGSREHPPRVPDGLGAMAVAMISSGEEPTHLGQHGNDTEHLGTFLLCRNSYIWEQEIAPACLGDSTLPRTTSLRGNKAFPAESRLDS